MSFSTLPGAAAAESAVDASLVSASGPSDDQQAIRRAATEYVADDAASASALATSAASGQSVPLVQSGTGVASSAAGAVEFAQDGDLSVNLPDGQAFGIGLGAGSVAEVVDDSVVVTDAATATDMVARATDGGVQVLAILADETAASEIAFPLELPPGSELSFGSDGSVAVLGRVERQVEREGESERIAEAAEAVLGGSVDSLEELDDVTDEQVELLAAIPDARTETVTVTERLAQIEAPWAVDANGVALPTRYVLDGDNLVQVVETTAETAFPVVADPSWTWWVEKGAKCVGGVISLGALGYAKVSVAIAKFVVKLKAAKAGTAAVSIGRSNGLVEE